MFVALLNLHSRSKKKREHYEYMFLFSDLHVHIHDCIYHIQCTWSNRLSPDEDLECKKSMKHIASEQQRTQRKIYQVRSKILYTWYYTYCCFVYTVPIYVSDSSDNAQRGSSPGVFSLDQTKGGRLLCNTYIRYHRR